MALQDSVQRSLQNPAEKSCRSAEIRKDQKHGHSSMIAMMEFFCRDILS